MILDDTLLDDLEAKAKQSPRLRMNLNLHDSLDSKAQRLLNALLPGTVIPIHRHRHTAETYSILRGRMFVVFYDSMGGAVERILLDSRSGHYGVHRAFGHPGGQGRPVYAASARGHSRLNRQLQNCFRYCQYIPPVSFLKWGRRDFYLWKSMLNFARMNWNKELK